MEFYDPTRNEHAPLSLVNLFSRAKLSDTDKSELEKRTGTIRGILRVIHETRPSLAGSCCHLHSEVLAAEAALIANPNRSAAEELHDRIIRQRDAEESFPRIDAALNTAIRSEIDLLIPLADRILVGVREDAVSEGAKVRRQLESGDKVFGFSAELHEFDRRLSRTLDFLDNEKVEIHKQNAALDWLSRQGFCQNPFHEPHDPPQRQEQPAAPLIRGRQKLPVEQLADEEL